MKLRIPSTHPEGEEQLFTKTELAQFIEVDTYDGKIHVEWDQTAAVTPLGQLSFFIQYLKVGGRLDPWVEDCPLTYASNNAPKKLDVLGSLLLSLLSGHTRYAHLGRLANDKVNAQLLGMKRIVSDDSARRALKRMDADKAISWMQSHLNLSYEPLLEYAWILDVDATVKCLYGHQEGAAIGYNPKKPGRPSHTYHSYLIANLRLVLEVDVQPGDQSHSSHALPGLIELIMKLPIDKRPAFVRGDCDWGSENVMSELEAINQRYLFKVRKSKGVKALINNAHCSGDWERFNKDFEGKEGMLKLQGWSRQRRVVVLRRRLVSENIVGVEHEDPNVPKQLTLDFIDEPEDIKAYQYSVLITDLSCETISIIQHYRDRGDCENYFDEVKNQWGWGGFTTQNISSCQIIARMNALVYNWWTLFVRLLNPTHHLEAITSRPLLLSSIARLTQSGRQKRLVITDQHNNAEAVERLYHKLGAFFNKLKQDAPQLTLRQRWSRILKQAMSAFTEKIGTGPPNQLPAPA